MTRAVPGRTACQVRHSSSTAEPAIYGPAGTVRRPRSYPDTDPQDRMSPAEKEQQ